MWTVASSVDDISHYGVKGMKWGVRKEYEPVGKKKKSVTPSGDYSRYDNTLSPAQKKRREAYKKEKEGYTKTIENKNGTTTIHIDGKDNYKHYRELATNWKDQTPSIYAPESAAIKKFNNLPKIKTNNSEGFERFAVNKQGPNYDRRMNCFECSIAYEMRKRGYDVQANSIRGGDYTELTHAFNLKDSFQLSSTSNDEAYKRMQAQCLSYGEGARGSVLMYWSTGGGHAINWEVKNGKFMLLDNQAGGDTGYESFMKSDPSDVRVARLDNAEVLPGVTDFVEPYETPHDAFYDKKWKKSMKTVIKEGMETVTKTLKKIGNDVVDFFNDPFDKSGKRKAKQAAKKKAKQAAKKKKAEERANDGRSFIERLLGITKETKIESRTSSYIVK